jgi:hypothetical protein
MRIFQHDARMNATRFANWDQDEQIAAAELGRRLADDPEAVIARLQRSSFGCAWLIGRWTLLGNALSTADEGGLGCTWTDADLALALNLLGRPADLRHLDDWPGRLESLCAQAQSGADEAVAELRQIVTDEVTRLKQRDEEVWEAVERPQLKVGRRTAAAGKRNWLFLPEQDEPRAETSGERRTYAMRLSTARGPH